MGLREARNVTIRNDDASKRSEFRKIYFVCEGNRTEPKYFKGIANNAKELGVRDSIDIIILKRDKESNGNTTPRQLIDLAKASIEEKKGLSPENFNSDIDKFIVVFDRDNNTNLKEFFEEEDQNLKIAFSNPCFEIWLLLHKPKSIDDIILPNIDKILENKKVSANHTYLSKIISDHYSMNCKSGFRFDKFQDYIQTAITQSAQLSQEFELLLTSVGTNIGTIISKEFFATNS